MQRIALPTVAIRGLAREATIIQGGMGVGVSLADLAGAVARRGGVGTVSFVALDRLVEKRIGRKVDHREGARLEVARAKELAGGRGAIALNVMVLVERSFKESVLGAVDAGVDIILAGAGLPMTLPDIVGDAPVALIPIVSSGRALELICRRWKRYGRTPDAVVLEGPLAGGHLGFRREDVEKPEFSLEQLFPEVKAAADANGGIPVIVAGGVYDRQDIVRWVEAGAAGVQMGTRFAATEESGASPDFKKALVGAAEDDIEVAFEPGSPSGLPFRVIKSSPGYQLALSRTRKPLCDKQYLLHPGKDGKLSCPALDSTDSFCICNVLLSAADYNAKEEQPIYTCGALAHRVDRIMPVSELMDELTGIDAR